MNPGIDLSCAKKVIIGDPVTGVCAAGEEEDAGLCYEKCNAGYKGVGPVCWGEAPKDWVECGMGSSTTSGKCAEIVFDQVSSVGQMALTIGTLGTSTGATAAANTGKSATRLAKLRADFNRMKTAFDKVKRENPKIQLAAQAQDAANLGKDGYEIMGAAQNVTTEEDMVRLSAQIAALLDPTGVAGTVAAYTYPVCSKLFGAPGAGNEVAGGTTLNTGTSGTSSSPVTLYQHANYQGASMIAGPGRYDIEKITVGNDQISSVRIEPGWRVILYQHARFGGSRFEVSSNVPFLSTFNDQVSSFEVIGANAAIPATRPTAGTLKWVEKRGGMPANAVVGGRESGRNLIVCRARHNSGVHPGKVVAGNCNIGWGGKELVKTSYEVLANDGANIRWVREVSPRGQVIGGNEPGRQLVICRAAYNGGLHPGKIVAGKCNIGWGGKEIQLGNPEILVSD
ncbi:MAG: DM9 repeat-containing protein [Gammaproteobacteria bacterium]